MIRSSLLCTIALSLLGCADKASSALGPDVVSAQASKPAPDPAPLPTNANAEAKLVDAYVQVAESLATDDAKGASKKAATLAQAAGAVAGPQAAQVKAAAREMAGASDIAALRAAFERACIAVITLVESTGNPLQSIAYVVRCPMAFDNRGARWLQSSASIRNPYFGASMLTCGTVQAQYAPGARKP